MGYSCVSDFARSISVMVRVRGPDPKGKKMKRHASYITDCGTTALSASGVLLLEMDLQAIIGGRSLVETATSGQFSKNIADSAAGESVYAGMVLTSASLIEPFLSKGLLQAGGVLSPQLITGAEVHILLENFSSNQLGWSASVDSAGEPGRQSPSFPGWMPMKVVAVVEMPGVEKGLKNLVEARGEGWDVGWALPVSAMEKSKKGNKISDGGHSTFPAIYSSGEGAGSITEELGHHSRKPFAWRPPSSRPIYGEGRDVRPNSTIGWEKESNEMRVAILGFTSNESHRYRLHQVSQRRHQLSTQLMPAGIHQARNVRRGARVTGCGSPFGVLSPHHFHNSVTVGVVSNMWPPCLSSGSAAVAPSLLMLDMRCLPGMEGGAVVDEDGNFVGMLDRPVRPRFGSAEVQLVLTADAIFPAVRPFAAAIMGAEDLSPATQQLNPASWSSANIEPAKGLGEGLKPHESPQELNRRWHERGGAPPQQVTSSQRWRERGEGPPQLGTSSIDISSQDASGPASLHHNPFHPKAITGHGSSHVLRSTMSSSQLCNFSVEPRAAVPVAEAASKSIVLVTAGEGSWASGIVLNSQGLILTNAHLLEPWRFGHERERRKGTNDTSFWMNSNEASAHHRTCADPSSFGDRQQVSEKHDSTFASGAPSGDNYQRNQNHLFLHILDDPPLAASCSLPSTTGGQYLRPSGTGMSVLLPGPQPTSADFPLSSAASLSELVPEPLSCLATNTSSAGSSYVKVMVRVDHPQPTMWHRAKVVYVSQGPLDAALLQLMPLPTRTLQGIGIEMRPPAVGSTAIVIGHGLFGPHSDLQASVSEGVVAKLVTIPQSDSLLSYTIKHSEMDQVPTMLQTTAAVHSGGSGGAVVDGNGNMIGLVTSNARHSGGSVLPHLNFSVPTALLARIFDFAHSGGSDRNILAEMDTPNQELAAVWSLTSPPTQAEDPSTVQMPVPLPWKLLTPPHRRQGAADGQDTQSSSVTVQPGKVGDSDARHSAVTTGEGQREGSGGEHRPGSKKGSKFAKFLANAGTDLFVSQQGPPGRRKFIRDRDRLRHSRDRDENREETQESTPLPSQERMKPAQGRGNEIQHGEHASNRDVFRRSRL